MHKHIHKKRLMEVVLEVVKESSGLLCANLSILFFITLTLIFPVSSITLSQVFTNGLLADKLFSHFQGVAQAGGLLESPFNRALYSILSQALLSHALCFPIIITLWLLAKTAILYIVNCSYHNKEASILGFLNEGPKLWSRLAITYIYTCMMVLGFAGLVLMCPLLVVGVMESLEVSRSFLGLLETPILMVFCVGFAHMLMVFDVANVISVVEKKCGGGALMRALFLLKGRVQLALILLCLSELAAFMAEGAFQNRVLGAHMSSPPTSLCEAPLLIFLYSFIHLFHAIMSFVFYRSCLRASCPACQSSPSPDTPSALQHLSIAVEMIEDCRKMYV